MTEQKTEINWNDETALKEENDKQKQIFTGNSKKAVFSFAGLLGKVCAWLVYIVLALIVVIIVLGLLWVVKWLCLTVFGWWIIM